VRVADTAATARTTFLSRGGWSLDFTNGQHALAHADLRGGQIRGEAPSARPKCYSGGSYAEVDCAAFTARGTTIYHTYGASADAWYWAECGGDYVLIWQKRQVTYAQVQRLIDSFIVLPGTGPAGCR
jgi:hypothetical protein